MEDRKINQVEYANLLSYLLTVYLQNNKVEHYSLPDLIRNVNESLSESISIDPSKWHSEPVVAVAKSAAPSAARSAAPSAAKRSAPQIAKSPAPEEDLGEPTPRNDPRPEDLPTPQAVRDSINDDYLISFEDGNKYKILTRHLALMGITPEEYRTKWGLPRNYPMVCKSTHAKRSAIATKHGLSQSRWSTRKGSKAR